MTEGGYAEFAPTVLTELALKGILDDGRLVERAVAELRSKGSGPELIRAKLVARGAPDTLLDAELSSGDEQGKALAAVRRKFRSLGAGDLPKVGRFLASKGFGEDVIESTLESLSHDLS